jgi:hypothetical protein
MLSDVKAVRAHQIGLDNLTDHLLFYPNSILREGARRLEECGLLTVSNDNVFE